MPTYFTPVNRSNVKTGVAVLRTLLTGYEAVVSEELLQSFGAEFPVDDTPFYQQIPTVSRLAKQVGLHADVGNYPADYLLCSENLPIVLATQLIPEDTPYFIVVWNKVGPLYQIMDPRAGRRWQSESDILKTLYQTETVVDETTLWARVQQAQMPTLLRSRLQTLKLSPEAIDAWVAEAYQDCRHWVLLDALVRMVSEMCQPRAIRAELQTQALLETWYETLREDKVQPLTWERLWEIASAEKSGSWSIPEKYWFVQPTDSAEIFQLQGHVGISVQGYTPVEIALPEADSDPAIAGDPAMPEPETAKKPQASTESEPISRMLLNMAREDGLLAPGIIASAILVAALAVSFQGIVLRGFMDLGRRIPDERTRAFALLFLIILVVSQFLLKWSASDNIRRVGRRIDVRLRMTISQIIPRISNRYFEQFSTGDISSRMFTLEEIQGLPYRMGNVLEQVARIAFILVGLLLIDWAVVPFAILKPFLGTLVYTQISPSMFQAGYRVMTFNGRLSFLFLDVLMGRNAIWSHGAERAVRHQYNLDLAHWGHANLDRRWLGVINMTFASVSSSVLTAFIVILYLFRGGDPVNLLLLFYWMLDLDQQIFQLTTAGAEIPYRIAQAARFAEVRDAPDEAELLANHTVDDPGVAEKSVKIDYDHVSIEIAGQTVLHDLTLTIEAGSQVGIVGTSGAGKSTLIGVLVGRYYAKNGMVRINDAPLSYQNLDQLRKQTAWVDPAIQLWNRSFFHNLRYGVPESDELGALTAMIEQSDLRGVLERLPDGLSSPLGEAGKRLSGGEGQRMRYGRALQRHDARLVLLDEPFRGLDRDKRKSLLGQARVYWKDATLICITHDVSQTLEFERVLVIDGGRVIQDGHPQALLEQPNSRYRMLLDEETEVREKLWESDQWRKFWLDNGSLTAPEAQIPD